MARPQIKRKPEINLLKDTAERAGLLPIRYRIIYYQINNSTKTKEGN